MAVDVRLSWREVRLAALGGVDRNIHAEAKGYRSGVYDAPADRLWQMHIDGSLAEWAVAKALGLFWPGGADDWFDRCDVGPVEVRSTPRVDGCLIVHKRDPDAPPFVFVVALGLRQYRLVGWVYGYEGKRVDYWRSDNGVRHPAYFVPQSALRPVEELRALVGAGA